MTKEPDYSLPLSSGRARTSLIRPSVRLSVTMFDQIFCTNYYGCFVLWSLSKPQFWKTEWCVWAFLLRMENGFVPRAEGPWFLECPYATFRFPFGTFVFRRNTKVEIWHLYHGKWERPYQLLFISIKVDGLLLEHQIKVDGHQIKVVRRVIILFSPTFQCKSPHLINSSVRPSVRSHF